MFQCHCSKCAEPLGAMIACESEYYGYGAWTSTEKNGGYCTLHCDYHGFRCHALCTMIGECKAINGTGCGHSDSNSFGNYCLASLEKSCFRGVDDKDGNYYKCDMCICDNFDDYVGGNKNCGGSNVLLFDCFVRAGLSAVDCKVVLKESWLVGFIFIAVLGSCLGCICLFHMCRRKGAVQVHLL